MSQENTQLQQAIQNFHASYTPQLEKLAGLLDAAGISHYSSGCGVKKVTYDIFPASHYIGAMIDLVDLNRNHKSKSESGLKDYSQRSEFNPASQFNQYLKRWGGFTIEVMKKDGDGARGVAAAKANLLIKELAARFASKPITKPNILSPKVAAVTREMGFAELMRTIGHTLETTKLEAQQHDKMAQKQRMEENYQKALRAASNVINTQKKSTQAA